MSRLLFAACATLLLLAGCGGKDAPKVEPVKTIAPPDAGHIIPDKGTDGTYTVNGEVVALPVQGDARTEFKVRHEAIDTFKNRQGKVVGMNAMTMDFPPAKGVDLRGLKVGDKVQVVFSVWWGNTPAWLATKVTRLPLETELEFRAANPPKDEAPAKEPATETPKGAGESKPGGL